MFFIFSLILDHSYSLNERLLKIVNINSVSANKQARTENVCEKNVTLQQTTNLLESLHCVNTKANEHAKSLVTFGDQLSFCLYLPCKRFLFQSDNGWFAKLMENNDQC